MAMARSVSLAGSALCSLLVAGPAPAFAQQEIQVAGPYFHRPAGTVYPERIGDFQRSNLVRYDADGRDVSASYNLATEQGRLLITVYIYPAPQTASAEARASACAQEVEAANNSIANKLGNPAPDERGAAFAAAGVDRSLGHRSVYRFSIPFDGRVQAIRSEAHLYCYVGGQWLVKYRVSAPVAVETKAAVETFIRTGPWPGRGSADTVALAD